MHKMAFNYYTKWHEHEIDSKDWSSVIQRSENTSREVSMLLSMPDSVQSSEAIGLSDARAQRILRLKSLTKKLIISKNRGILCEQSLLKYYQIF